MTSATFQNTHKTSLTISILYTKMQNSADWLSRSHPWKSHEKFLKIKPLDRKLSLQSVVSTTALFFYYMSLLKNTSRARRFSLLWNSILIKNETYKKFTNLHAFHLMIVPIPLHSHKHLQSRRGTPICSFGGLRSVPGFLRPIPKQKTRTQAVPIGRSGWSTRRWWSFRVAGQLVWVVHVLNRLNSSTYVVSSS